MNKAFLLGGIFLCVTSVYAAATHGDLIAEGRRRNENVYEHSLEETGWKISPQAPEQKIHISSEDPKSSSASKIQKQLVNN